jgi:hypothetical protein
MDEARTAAKGGLALDPEFTIGRLVATLLGDNPTYLAGRERICEGMLWLECRRREGPALVASTRRCAVGFSLTLLSEERKLNMLLYVRYNSELVP